MGEFTTRLTYSNIAEHRGPGDYVYGLDADYIYSWRTRVSPADVKGRTVHSNGVGVRSPKQTGNLLDVMADRKRFTEEIMSSMNPREFNSAIKKDVVSLTDAGHPFTSVKHRTLSVGGLCFRSGSSSAWGPSDPIYATDKALVPAGVGTTQLPFTTVSSAPRQSVINSKVNAAFDGMRVDKEIAQIGETLVSLLRGDFPRLFKRIEESFLALAVLNKNSVKGALKTTGSEYLNSVFGWTPLIRDFENAIKVLTTVDHLIYGTSYRRHREIRFDNWSENISFKGYSSTAFNERRISHVSSIPSFLGYANRDCTFDIRLSARLVPLARPGLGSNRFIEEAEEVVRNLGLWYPALGWDLLPYSWLIDWFTHLGSSLTNAMTYGSTPGMTNIDYAWATSCLRTIQSVGPKKEPAYWSVGTNQYMYTGHARSFTTVKQRSKVTPFGAGLDLGKLNASEISILVMLGFAKIP